MNNKIHRDNHAKKTTGRKRIEEALRVSEAMYRSLFDYAPVGIVIADNESYYLDANASACKMLGYTRDELVGLHASDIVTQAETEHIAPALDGIKAKSEYFREWQFRRKDGSVFSAEVTATTMPDGKLLGIIRDTTERKQAEMYSTRLAAIVESSDDAIISKDLNGVITSWNAGAELIFGYTADEMLGTPVMRLIPADRQDEENQILAKLSRGEKVKHLETLRQTKDERLIEVLITTSPIRDAKGKVIGASKIVRDIKVLKDREREIARMSQLYAALSQCNQAIVRHTSEAELLPQICRDAVNYGGFQMAWIGMIDEASKLIRPVAAFGSGIEYLDEVEISVDTNSPGREAADISIRSNQPTWCQAFQHDQAHAAWHQRAAKFGWKGSASLPLQKNGVAVGFFNLYTSTANEFDNPVKNLLIEMALDISFALDNFDREVARKYALEKIKFQNTILNTQQETSLDAILVVDEHGQIISYSQKFIDLWQLPPQLVNTGLDAPVFRFVAEQVVNTEAFTARIQHLHEHHEDNSREEILLKDGRIIDRYSAPIIAIDDIYYGRVWYFRDITERKHAEERIKYLANFDALTGLPNRAQLADHLKYALSLAKRSNEQLSMMFIDIDRFKDINDTLGHSIGDALLVEVAGRLKSLLREEDIVSRLGGDEFILILPGGDALGAAQVGQKLLDAISRPYQIEQYNLVVTASIGIARYPMDGTDLESLSRSADTAMYRAKHEGRNGYRFFTSEMQARASRNMQLVHALHHALKLDQFQLHYQPQVSMRDKRIIGVEVLLRWQHPDMANVSPAEFIPVAEDSRLILPIGEWVLRTAVNQLKRWINDGHPPMVIAVNLSAVQFRHPSLPDLVSSILREAHLAPEYLELELTEGVAMHDPQGAISVMNNLRERGIRMSIDDFGTGYSSLNYLKKFKASKLKIDQSFVRDISTDLEDKAIVAAIISMARDLGLRTIAEGVETAEQLAYLCEQGCDEAQGYYFSKPLPGAQLGEFLADIKI
ncbi:MAG: EAL domain-containing protein [Pseudomonadota bacterium]